MSSRHHHRSTVDITHPYIRVAPRTKVCACLNAIESVETFVIEKSVWDAAAAIAAAAAEAAEKSEALPYDEMLFPDQVERARLIKAAGALPHVANLFVMAVLIRSGRVSIEPADLFAVLFNEITNAGGVGDGDDVPSLLILYEAGRSYLNELLGKPSNDGVRP